MDKRTVQEFESMLHDFETVSEVQAKEEVNGANVAVMAYAISPVATEWAKKIGSEIAKKLFG
ncbi:hypothetical protein [[Clostridium] polysaccharolyticum]|jgi:hypothetical protein|uniref:Uncharacterized protein n=1 Tax=[Clostridium] polysaccharolyticum TaxID=29364 RepID=A0A1I0D1J1_9FIRM|nr:hypothetical protein [[Clostridium] polysaccharolyticum]SET26022.1 hypothetical protein SAMN04487772_11268 [[Clostridium] polysaccharolyticum]